MKKMLLVLALVASFGSFSTSVYAKWVCFTDGTCIDIGDIGVHP